MAEKIAAVATGHARTGIGILRLSGDGCIEAAGQVFHLQSGKPLSSLPPRSSATARPPRWPRGSRRCSPPGSGRRGRANLHAVRF